MGSLKSKCQKCGAVILCATAKRTGGICMPCKKRRPAQRSAGIRIFGIKLDLFGEENPKRMPWHLFFGASHLDYKSAQRADILKQNYTVCPRHWYVNATFQCSDCKKEFVFTADEQRFWYEDRQFWIDSLPKRCVTCRKAERARLDLKKRYDQQIATTLRRGAPEPKSEMLQLIDELEAAEGSLPERMRKNREVLRAQLAKISARS